MIPIDLNRQEVGLVMALAKRLIDTYSSVEDRGFLADARVHCGELPFRLRKALNDFRLKEPLCGALLVRGFDVDQRSLGATPQDWDDRPAGQHARFHEFVLALIGSYLGDCIGWSTQQNGRIMHDIFPIKAHENDQLGVGSATLLTWHTEDAFHPMRGDYVALYCLRNPNRAATLLGNLEGIDLRRQNAHLLFEPHFTIEPDYSHRESYRNSKDSRGDPRDATRYEVIHQMLTAPEKISVLFGNPDSPYLRLDPYFMKPAENLEAQRVLEWLIKSIDKRLVPAVLQPGELLIVDNYRAVHGRQAFDAKFDGTDRWLKRINVVRDLRLSSAVRSSLTSRLLS